MATTQIKDGYQGGSDNQAFVDSTGHLLVTGTFTPGPGTGDVNIVQVGGTAISLGQKLSIASFPVVISSDQSPIPITGTVTAVNASVGLTGVTAPTSATEIGAVDSGGNLQHLLVDPAGKLLVDISGTSVVTGTVNANIEGLTAFQTSQYPVGITSVQLTPTPLTNRSSMSMKADLTSPSEVVYIGNSSGVTTSTGYALFNGDSLQLDLTPAQQVWAIASAPGQLVYVLEIGD